LKLFSFCSSFFLRYLICFFMFSIEASMLFLVMGG
jgi:hypothetical protein